MKFVPLAFFLAALFYFVVRIVHPSSNVLTHGFAAYDTAARLAFQGKAGPQLYDFQWFNEQVAEITNGQAGDVYFPNPPTMTLLFSPFVMLDPSTSRAVWTWLNVVFLFAALALLTIVTRLNLDIALLLSALVLVAKPVAANFGFGQAYVFLLFLFALALAGLRHGRERIAGASLGLALILKASGMWLWLLLLARKQGLALSAGVVVVVLVAMASIPLVGLDMWQFYFTQELSRFLEQPSNSVTAYQTTFSFLQHLFRFDAQWNPRPLLDAPWLARALTLAISLGALAVSLWRSRSLDTLSCFGIFLILSVVLTPVAQEYHFVLMVIPLFILTAQWLKHPEPLFILLGAAAMLLLSAPLAYQDPSLSAAPAALFAYPRLYGSWILWGLLLRKFSYS